MDLLHIFRPLIFFFLLSFHARAENVGSVFFLDSPIHQYLRTRPSDAIEAESMLLPEVGAAVSVLLGFAPPSTLSAATSSKLNEILMPNPFSRPRAVSVLEVRGAEGLAFESAQFSSVRRTRIIAGSNKADIQLPDKEEISVVHLNEPLLSDSDADFNDKEVTDFASWLGGSYVTDSSKPLSGEFSVPLASGAVLKLHMSKKADRKFVASLVSLIHNIRSAIKVHEDLLGRNQGPAELMSGNFDGIKVLQEQDRDESVAQQGFELFVTAVSKIFDLLQASYKGELVGVIFFNDEPSPEFQTSLNVTFTSRSSSRCLVESPESLNPAIIAQQFFVRRTLAWVTGIVLLIATLLGIYFLFYMPITKDSLLYSNVKLD